MKIVHSTLFVACAIFGAILSPCSASADSRGAEAEFSPTSAESLNCQAPFLDSLVPGSMDSTTSSQETSSFSNGGDTVPASSPSLAPGVLLTLPNHNIFASTFGPEMVSSGHGSMERASPKWIAPLLARIWSLIRIINWATLPVRAWLLYQNLRAWGPSFISMWQVSSNEYQIVVRFNNQTVLIIANIAYWRVQPI